MALKATIHIETGRREEVTILKNSFCTPPFKIANVTEDSQDKELHLMLMSSSPGVLDGDNYSFNISLSEGSKLRLQTQSFQRLFQMKIGALQTTEVKMGAGSTFSYLPHPVVPHQNAIFQSKNRLFLEDGCSLLWGEVICCGRKMNGEVFQFQSYHSTTEIFQKGRVVVKENLLFQPRKVDLHAIGQLEGYTHQATFIFIHQTAVIEQLISELVEWLNPAREISFGVTALPVNGLLVRLLGYKAEQLFALLQQIAAFVTDAWPSIQKWDTYV